MTHNAAKSHPSVKGEQAQSNEHGRDEGTEQTGDEVGAILFQHLAIRHDGAGQVGKVALAEKGQGQLAQPLRKGQAASAALFIGRKIKRIMDAYQGVEDKFADKFLEEDGSLKTGVMAEKATAAYHKVEDTVVGGYKKVEKCLRGCIP